MLVRPERVEQVIRKYRTPETPFGLKLRLERLWAGKQVIVVPFHIPPAGGGHKWAVVVDFGREKHQWEAPYLEPALGLAWDYYCERARKECRKG